MSEILKVGFDDPLSIQSLVAPARIGAFHLDTIREQVDGVTAVRNRPGYQMSVPTGTAGTPQGITQFNGDTYCVVNDTFIGINAAPSGANGTAWLQDSIGAGWQGRSAFDAVSFNGSLYIIGGRTQSNPVAQGDVWISKNGGVTWGLVTSSAPFGARFGHRVVVFNGAMYLLGGYYQTGGFAANDTWMTTDGTNWVQTNGGAVSFPGRAFFGAVATSGGIYVMGGTDGSSASAGTSKNDVWFSADGINWAQVSGATSWTIRCDFDVVSYNNLLVLVGGVNSTTSVGNNECWTSPDGLTWTQATSAALSSGTNRGVRLLVYGGKMWALGGFFFPAGGSTPGTIYSSSNPSVWSLVGTSGLLQTAEAAVCVNGVNKNQNNSRLSSMFYIGGLSFGGGASSTTANATLNVIFGTAALSPDETGQPYQFQTFKYGSCLLIKNQSNMWVFEGGVVKVVTDKRYPSTTVPGLVILGGFAYVMDPTGLIVNCDFNNPQYWPGQNYVGADYDADGGQCIDKLQNYLVAFGPNSTQLFYDAGTPVGSPLLPYLAGNQRFGCCDALSVASIDNNLYWYGQDETGARGIATFNGLKAQIISPPAENLILKTYARNSNAIRNFLAFGISTESHNFYVYPLNFDPIAGWSGVGFYGSLVLDITTKRWQFWTPGTAPPLSLLAFPFQSATLAFGLSASAPISYGLSSDGAWVGKFSELANGDYVSTTFYQIGGTCTTKIYDAGNNRTKFWGRMDVISDQAVAALGNDNTTVDIRTTDDSYISSSGTRTMNLSSIRPTSFRWGSSRKRAYQLSFSGFRNTQLICRVKNLEIEYDQGS